MIEETEVDQEPPPPAPPKRRRRRRLLALILLVGVVLVGGAAGYTVWAMGGTPHGPKVEVVIPQGASGGEIASILQRDQIVRSAFVFRIVARLRGLAKDLKPGAYFMQQGLGVNGAINALRNGVPLVVYRFTIPEGKTIPEIASIIAAHTKITAADFLRAVHSGKHRLSIMPKGSTNLEGLLFPKTYEILDKTTADQVVDMMLQQFEKETVALAFSRAAALKITPYQAVIIASMIEREAKIEKDRPLIASVIYNRLARPMRLQIDATVEYAILLQTGHYKDPLTQQDYTSVQSPYNTYLIDGLPPAPIASPGLPSLAAALSPASTNYYFYILSSDQRSQCFARDQAALHNCP